jgi:hypothetical protein
MRMLHYINRSLFALALAGLIAVCPRTAQAGQTGPLDALYLTAGDQSTNIIIQGTSMTTFSQAGLGNGTGDEYAIAVGSTVRTLSNGNAPTGFGNGAEYTLGGTFTGTTFAYPGPGAFYDGTRDASHNYSADFHSGNIYSFNTNWTNPTLLFNSGISNSLGITYDSKDNTLWVSGFLSNSVSEFTLSGTLLTSFAVTGPGVGFVAYDGGDDSLWFGSRLTSTIYQYDTSGNLLQSPTYASLANYNVLGGEFAFQSQAVPEPASMTLAGIGALGASFFALARRRLNCA